MYILTLFLLVPGITMASHTAEYHSESACQKAIETHRIMSGSHARVVVANCTFKGKPEQ